MNFKISKRILFNALSVVARAISANSPLPWLTGVKIEIKDGELILTGSDSDISIQKVIQKNEDDYVFEIQKEGSIVIEAKYILDIGSSLGWQSDEDQWSFRGVQHQRDEILRVPVH
jgi:DNA polymerase-3 subunit beta